MNTALGRRGLSLRAGITGFVLASVLVLGGCDFEVTNPGPVADRFLDNPASHEALVNGMSRALSDGLNRVGFASVVAAREMVASGGTGNRGHTPQVKDGIFDPNDDSWAVKWNTPHRARWMAEQGGERIRSVIGDEEFGRSRLGARSRVYAGYANRLLGENMCLAVIDGGAAEPHTVHYERAESHFTEALEISRAGGYSDLELAALAGRASVRAHLGDWSGAVADAQLVPDSYEFEAIYTMTTQDENNRFVDANLNSPWRSFTVHGTWFNDYYVETGDPRTPWGEDPENPLGDGIPVPWHFEMKYVDENGERTQAARAANINLSSGREMRLLEAESMLRNGQWEQALARINALREGLVSDHTGDPLPLWEATTENEAWTALKLERFIELWIEGRMLGYQREWIENGVPGELPADFDMTGRSLCYPIPSSEILTNPNVNGPTG